MSQEEAKFQINANNYKPKFSKTGAPLPTKFRTGLGLVSNNGEEIMHTPSDQNMIKSLRSNNFMPQSNRLLMDKS